MPHSGQDAAPLYHPVTIGQLELSGNLFLAPVAGYSDRAFRSLCVSCGANFTYTEMVSSEALTRDSDKTRILMQRAENEQVFAVQLFGGDPDRTAAAASTAVHEAGADCIDINAGCPVPKIIKTGAGAALTRDPDRLQAITAAVVRAVSPIPVTVKIRSGWDEKQLTWDQAARAAISAGASAITLHPRTRAQGYEGTANRDLVGELVSLVRKENPVIPVFASGDLFTPQDAKTVLETTGCDGVMFARGAIGNPFIFTQTREFLESGTTSPISADKRMKAGWKELQDLVADTGEQAACRIMRKRFSAYSKGIPGGAMLRSALVQAETVEDYRRILETQGIIPD